MEREEDRRESVTWRRWSDGGMRTDENESSGRTHPLFTELVQLSHDNWGRLVWNEVARWVKYEEDVEECGSRWSKPFVPTVGLSSLQDLVELWQEGQTVLLLEYPAVPECVDSLWTTVVDKCIEANQLVDDQRGQALHALMARKSHLFQQDRSIQLNVFKKSKQTSRPGSRKGSEAFHIQNIGGDRRKSFQVAVTPGKLKPKALEKTNTQFLKKITKGSESFIILVGEMNSLKERLSVFIRLAESTILTNLTEVSLPTRFIFILMGPRGELEACREMGRVLATAMLDPSFREVAYTFKSSGAFVDALENYSSGATVLPPPPEWDPAIRIEPQAMADDDDDEANIMEQLESSGLIRTGRLFGCFIKDIKRKLPWYGSDFRDAISLQCVATWLFLYFAALTPIITFGGILGEATHSYMGTMETIVAAAICGITFALFGGQPLIILGATGPMLVFEKIIISVCDDYPELELNYLELRLSIGLWVGVILIILVATEASSLVAYITKFTEENFATLISIIFMVEAIKNLSNIAYWTGDMDEEGQNETANISVSRSVENSTVFGMPETTQGPTNSFLLCILLFVGTFFISFLLKEFRLSTFFSTRVRVTISDFAVILAIASMSGLNALIGLPVPKLVVPSKFAPTIPDRGWFVPPFVHNAPWTIFAAIIPAALATILIFMDQQITAVIINRKSYKLKKGAGYHLDLFVLACLIIVNSFLGLPWFVAATVESVTNIGSLKLESEAAAPGEKPQFLGVREQRVSNLLVYITVGLSVFLTPLLRQVPMAVLFGVFLYMGFSAIRKMELLERILLFLIPPKYQPDTKYLRQVPMRKIHLFTLIQCTCLGILWVIKSIPSTAMLFPLMLVVMIGVRKSLEFVFTHKELAALDDILPSKSKDSKEEVDDVTKL